MIEESTKTRSQRFLLLLGGVLSLSSQVGIERTMSGFAIYTAHFSMSATVRKEKRYNISRGGATICEQK